MIGTKPVCTSMLVIALGTAPLLASSGRGWDPMVDWKQKNVAPVQIMIGGGADARQRAMNIFSGNQARQQAFKRSLALAIEQEMSERGFKTTPESQQAVGIEIWGRLEDDRECPRIIYSLRLWFGDSPNSYDEDVETGDWAREIVGSATDTALENSLISAVREMLDYDFPEKVPNRK